jgi:hypothetical protein
MWTIKKIKRKGQKKMRSFLRLCVKAIDIGYVTLLYMLLAMFMVWLFDFRFDDTNTRTLSIVYILLELWLFGILTCLAREVVQKIPFVLDGAFGYDSSELKERDTPWVFGLIFLAASTNMQHRLLRVMGTI